MKTRRIIAIVLVVLMSFSVLASCGETEKYQKENKGDGSDIDTQFRSADYEGDRFTFATFTSTLDSGSEYYTGEWIDSDEISGIATSDAVYKRNQICEQKYNVDIEQYPAGEGFEEYSTLYNLGDFTFDIVYGWASRFSVGVTTGIFHDFKDLEDQGYIDMEANYWNPDVNKSLEVADRSFIVVNDITMTPLSWTGCVFFNPQIIEDLNLENPHDLVKSGNWTLDKFLEMISQVEIDKDGDPEFTIEDCYGIIDMGTANALLYGCDVHLVDSDYNLAIGGQKIIDLITKIHSALSAKNVFDMDAITKNGRADVGGDQWAYTRSYFANGHSLFLCGTPELTREFRGMEGGYGIVPLPKYDASQKDYTSTIDNNAGAFLLPNFEKRTDGVNSSYERTGTILEYLAYKSSEDVEGSVLNAYYETTIKGQRQTIEENKDMLDEFIKGSGRFEWADVFWVGGSISDQDSTISGVLGSMASSGIGLASTYKRSATRLQKAIDDIYATIDGLS